MEYNATNTDGRSIRFNWEGQAPPTEQDVNEIVAAQSGAPQAAAPAAPSLSLGQRLWNALPSGQQWIHAAAQAAPGAGAVAGGMIGGGAGLFGGPFAPATSTAGAIGGGALGGMLGESVRQLIEPPASTGQALVDLGKEGFMGGLGAGPGAAADYITMKSLGPFADQMTPEAVKVAQLLQDKNLPISPSVVNPSWLSKAIQKTSDWAPGASDITNWYRGKLQDRLTNIATDLRSSVSDDAIANMEAQTTKGYSEALDSIPSDTVDMSNSLGAIKSVYANLSKKAKQTADTVLAKAGISSQQVTRADGTQATEWVGDGSELPIDDVKQLKQQLSTIASKNVDVKKTLNKALMDDLSGVEGGDQAVQALKDTDSLYRLQQASKTVNRILGRSIGTDGVTENFKPLSFEQNYTSQARKVIARDYPSIVPQLDDLLQISQAAKTDIAKYASSKSIGSQFIQRGIELGTGKGVLSEALNHPVATGVPILGGLAMANSNMNPNGWLRQWLTTGLAPQGSSLGPLADAMTRMGLANNARGIPPSLNLGGNQ
jgi:hypothetical protein